MVATPPPAPTIVTQVIVIATNPPVPLPPALKLQMVLFSPSRPSAMINGKTVFVGDRIGDARVVAITQTTVSVLQDGQTNVLSLD
jgi:MSHA biogenesis protein MshK